MLGIAVGAFGLLLALGVLIGHLLDRRAQEAAWRRIAVARRINSERSRELDEIEADAPDPLPPVRSITRPLARTVDPDDEVA